MHQIAPLFFKFLLEKIKVDVEKVIYIDDSPHKLQSARQHGIQGILFQNNQQVKSVLK